MTITRGGPRAQELERRIDGLEQRLQTVERVAAEIEGLKKVVADLKYEVEQMVEA
jgi:uncharacterized coiled-coil protein SlyX